MSVKGAMQPKAVVHRKNRWLGWALGAVALLMYAAIGLRWTRAF